MSLLDTGPDTVTAWPAVWGADEEGNRRWLPGGVGVSLSGVSVQDTASNTEAVEGQRSTSGVRVIARGLPDGVDADALTFGHVVWGGWRWVLDGRPQFARRTSTVAHVSWSMTRDRREA